MAAVVVAAAGLVRGYGGFGGGLVAIPLLSLIYGPVEAYAMTAIIGVPGYVPLLPRAVRIADWTELAPTLAAATVATPIGVAALVIADPELIRRLIGLFVLLGAALLATGWVYRGRRGCARRRDRRNAVRRHIRDGRGRRPGAGDVFPVRAGLRRHPAGPPS